MGIPQLILLGLLLWSAFCWIYDLGKGKLSKKELGINLIALGLLMVLLWWGGFWA